MGDPVSTPRDERTQRLRALRQSETERVAIDPHAAEAMLSLAHFMALSDGALSDDEYDELLALYEALLGDEASEETLDDLLEDGAEALDVDGLDVCLASAAEQLETPEQRRLAFELCAGMAALDAELDDDELALFDRLAKTLGLSTAESRAIVAAWQQRLA